MGLKSENIWKWRKFTKIFLRPRACIPQCHFCAWVTQETQDVEYILKKYLSTWGLSEWSGKSLSRVQLWKLMGYPVHAVF